VVKGLVVSGGCWGSRQPPGGRSRGHPSFFLDRPTAPSSVIGLQPRGAGGSTSNGRGAVGWAGCWGSRQPPGGRSKGHRSSFLDRPTAPFSVIGLRPRGAGGSTSNDRPATPFLVTGLRPSGAGGSTSNDRPRGRGGLVGSGGCSGSRQPPAGWSKGHRSSFLIGLRPRGAAPVLTEGPALRIRESKTFRGRRGLGLARGVRPSGRYWGVANLGIALRAWPPNPRRGTLAWKAILRFEVSPGPPPKPAPSAVVGDSGLAATGGSRPSLLCSSRAADWDVPGAFSQSGYVGGGRR